MTYPSAEEPDRPEIAGQAASAEPAEPPEKAEPPEPSEKAEAQAGGQLCEPAAPVLSEKPVLEWTTEDWARWIEEPALLSPPAPKANAGAGAGAGTEDEQAEQAEPLPPVVAEDIRIEGDPTATWSLPVDEDDEDAKWWSAVAGLPNVAAATPPPAPPGEAAPEPTTPASAPITKSPPPAPAPTITPPPAPPAEVPQPPAPPATYTGPSDPETAAHRPRHTRTAPEAAPSRSPQSRRTSLEPVDDMAVRVRAGLSLLGVSILVGAVTAGLITVAIFMASVVLRRALG